ncbi:MAG: hypothetical protein ACOYB1_18335 [Limnohabitans sp.]
MLWTQKNRQKTEVAVCPPLDRAAKPGCRYSGNKESIPDKADTCQESCKKCLPQVAFPATTQRKKYKEQAQMKPNIENRLIDPERNITYIIIAYKRLTKEDMKSVVSEYFSRKGTIKPQHGRTYRLNCLLGLNE